MRFNTKEPGKIVIASSGDFDFGYVQSLFLNPGQSYEMTPRVSENSLSLTIEVVGGGGGDDQAISAEVAGLNAADVETELAVDNDEATGDAQVDAEKLTAKRRSKKKNK